MEGRNKVIMTAGILVVLVVGLYFFSDWFSKSTGYVAGDAEKEAITLCLNQKNVQLYCSIKSPGCEKQKEIFGSLIKNIYQVSCDEWNCSNVNSVPAWYIGNKFVYGSKTIEELKKLSGC